MTQHLSGDLTWTSSQADSSQFRKCTLTQNVLCSTLAPGMSLMLRTSRPACQALGILLDSLQQPVHVQRCAVLAATHTGNL